MKQITCDLEKLYLDEEEAKKVWKDAVRAANQAVSVAHQNWVLADKALTEAQIRAKAQSK